MHARPTVHLLCGFIGAGKTTFARELESRTGAVRITKDEWLIQIVGNDPTIEGYADFDQRVVKLSRNVAFQIVAKGMDVILDEGFWAKDERMWMRVKFEELGAQVLLYCLDTPIETIRERVARRSADPPPDSFVISADLLDHYLPFWQPPSEDECHILVDTA